MGLALRLDDLENRLEHIETEIDGIKEHLVTGIRSAQNTPDVDAPFD